MLIVVEQIGNFFRTSSRVGGSPESIQSGSANHSRFVSCRCRRSFLRFFVLWDREKSKTGQHFFSFYSTQQKKNTNPWNKVQQQQPKNPLVFLTVPPWWQLLPALTSSIVVDCCEPRQGGTTVLSSVLPSPRFIDDVWDAIRWCSSSINFNECVRLLSERANAIRAGLASDLWTSGGCVKPRSKKSLAIINFNRPLTFWFPRVSIWGVWWEGNKISSSWH